MSDSRIEKKEKMQNHLLLASAYLFIKKGYSNTSVDEICRHVGFSNSNHFFRIFPTKEAALIALIPHALQTQLNLANLLAGNQDDKILCYAFNNAAEYYACEASEAIRDLYIATYTLSSVSTIIYKTMASKLQYFFGEYFPDYQEKDFYELDVATSGIVRNYFTIKCDMYFPLSEKIKKSTEATLRVFRVPEEKIKSVIDIILSIDMTEKVNEAINGLITQLEIKVNESNSKDQ